MPVCARSLEMSAPSSFSEPRTTGSSISVSPWRNTAGFSSATAGSFSRVGSNLPTDPSIDRRPLRLRSDPGESVPIQSAAMDFDLSEDQLALRDGARALLDDLAPTTRVRAVADTATRVDTDLWSAMVDQGWLGIAVPEADGGVGLGAVELAVLLEEIGRHVAPAPFLPTVLAIDVFGRTGDRETVGALLGGERTACIAWSKRADAVR